jgi:hypothetical protein
MNAFVPLFLIAPLVLVPLLPTAGILVVSFWLPAGPGGVTGPRDIRGSTTTSARSASPFPS